MSLQFLAPTGTGDDPDHPYDYGVGSVQACNLEFPDDQTYNRVELRSIAGTENGVARLKSPEVVIAVPVLGADPPFTIYCCTTPKCGVEDSRKCLRVKKAFALDRIAAQGPPLALPPDRWIIDSLADRLATAGVQTPLVFHVYQVDSAGIPDVDAGGYVAIPVANTLPEHP